MADYTLHVGRRAGRRAREQHLRRKQIRIVVVMAVRDLDVLLQLLLRLDRHITERTLEAQHRHTTVRFHPAHTNGRTLHRRLHTVTETLVFLSRVPLVLGPA